MKPKKYFVSSKKDNKRYLPGDTNNIFLSTYHMELHEEIFGMREIEVVGT